MMDLKVKICGMKYPENIQEVALLKPDFLGFIFYDKSKRLCAIDLLETHNLQLSTINKVGVFVNESIKNIIKIATRFELDYIQLHGDESPEFCEELNYLDFKIIKAFGIDDTFDFSILDQYEEVCSYFLFDTKSANYGGTGQQFNWDLLQQYHLKKPVFLSGGLDISDIEKVMPLLKTLPIYALDFNSKLELEAGLKDVQKCADVIQQCNNVTMR